MKQKKRIHFVGVGGMGLSALAQLASWEGCRVSGSDRDFDAGRFPSLKKILQREGITVVPQDGSGSKGADTVVISPAVEDHIPDVAAARKAGIGIASRWDFLKRLSRGKKVLAVSGTNGKSTTTALLGWILQQNGFDPSLVLGAVLKEKGKGRGNARRGDSEWFCLEADESDGGIAGLHSYLAVITNITPDHFPLSRLDALFASFAENCEKVLISNADCPRSRKLSVSRRITFATESDADFRAEGIELRPARSLFRVSGENFEIPLAGLHNVRNALASAAAASALGISPRSSAAALRSFPGLERRSEVIFSGDVTVIDDYAHNPAKVEAALGAARLWGERVVAVYQPHGFAPLRNLLSELAGAFHRSLRSGDQLLLLPVYYAGGTVEKSIGPGDLKKEIGKPSAVFTMAGKDAVLTHLKNDLRRGDVVLVMGGRDPGLGGLSRRIAQLIKAPGGLF